MHIFSQHLGQFNVLNSHLLFERKIKSEKVYELWHLHQTKFDHFNKNNCSIPSCDSYWWLFVFSENDKLPILGLQLIPGDPKDSGVAAMLVDSTFCFVIQHGRHDIVFLDLQISVANQECL